MYVCVYVYHKECRSYYPKVCSESVYSEADPNVLKAKLVKGTQGEVKFWICRKKICTQFNRLLKYQVNDGKTINKKNCEKSLGSAGGNITYLLSLWDNK